jgi:hypothetical protein
VWTAQAFELAALKQGNLASSGLGGMAGCAASPEPTSLAINREITGKFAQKLANNGKIHL